MQASQPSATSRNPTSLLARLWLKERLKDDHGSGSAARIDVSAGELLKVTGADAEAIGDTQPVIEAIQRVADDLAERSGMTPLEPSVQTI